MHSILILILSLSCFAQTTVDEIVVTARAPVRNEEFKRLFNRMLACRIQKEDDCRNAYLDFEQHRVTEVDRYRLTADERKAQVGWENYAIGRLHQLDLDYNSIYIDNAVYSGEIDLEAIKKESSRSELTPLASGVYSREEAQARSALTGRKQTSSMNSGSLCEVPLDASGITFVSQATGTGMPDAYISDAIALKKVDWLALEQLPQTMQPTIDTFLNANESSKEFKQAQRELRTYFGVNGKDQTRTDSGDRKNRTLEYLKAARDKKVRIVAIGADPSYSNRGPRTDALVAGTRNLAAANAIPTEGSGLVVSNWRDFHFPQNAKIQDFYANRSTAALTLREPDGLRCELTDAQTQACQAELTKYNAPAASPNENPFRCLRQKAAQLGGACTQALAPIAKPQSSQSGRAPTRATGAGSIR